MWILALALLAAASPAVAAPSPPATEQLLARAQAAYQRGDLCAAFEQTHIEKVRGRKKVESGRLWAKRDGRVRWTYEQPTYKDFVYDGRKAWFYEPENAQVTEFEKFEQSPLWSALRFLWGQGRITETFAVAPCDKDCPKAGPGVQQLALTPKQPLAAVERVVFEIDPASALVRRSVVYDPLGNRSEYVFTEVTLGCRVAERKFAFERPKDVSVIRASGDTAR